MALVKVAAQICVLMILLETAYASWNLPKISDYATHPCRRDCRRTQPMKCEYDFIVEHYQTLSRACYNCPHNISDCDRPHCVPGDGFLRAIKVVNRMMPGPAIHVCKDDEVLVNVHNELADFEGTGIHWHGILQEGTPHMDGVVMVTQCPIPTHSAFQYRFRAGNPGTHYWHAHAGLQRGDGIFGALVVRDTSDTFVKRYYDEDLPEHTIIFQDWMDQYSSSKFSLHHHGMSDNYPSSILINGRGPSHGVPVKTMNMNMHEMMKMVDNAEVNSDVKDNGTISNDGMNGMDKNNGMDGNNTEPSGTMMNDAPGTMNMEDHSTMDMDSHSTMVHKPNGEQENVSFVPHSVFTVFPGKRYRFRLISNGLLNCPLKISLENHTFTIIASDGYDIDPIRVDSLTMFAGERYDVVLLTDKEIGNYWMHVVGLGDCADKRISQTSIVRYMGARPMHPKTGNEYSDGDRSGTNGNPMGAILPNHVTVADMKSRERPMDVYTTHNVKTFYMTLGYNEVENPRFLDSEFYPLDTMASMHTGSHGNHLFALQMNYITFRMPMSPVLSQLSDLGEDIFCNETHTPKNCRKELCECVHRLKVDLGDIVELVLISDGKHGLGNHPMHLHGHSFYVLGMERLNNSITRETIEELDVRGLLKRNLRNPITKDTVMVPDGGYTIIRFKADNPGFWLFHCHVDFHFALGMSLVIQVGDITDMMTTPTNFPRCGSWQYTSDGPDYYAKICAQYTNGVEARFVSSKTVLILIVVMLLVTFTKRIML